jgi:acyl dehydratase
MALDRSLIGREPPGQTLLVTRSRLRAFARATGQTDPVYTDVDAARQEQWYGMTMAFAERQGHAQVPVDYAEDGWRLGSGRSRQPAS